MYVVRGKKMVTVGKLGTIDDGAMVIENGKIVEIGKWERISQQYPLISIIDYSHYVITPSLVDCHTHLLEFAPTSLYPVTPETHFIAGKALLLHALSSGITALGEQICGHPLCDFSVKDYKDAVKDVPLDVTFATTSISIGFDEIAHFTSITQSKRVMKSDLVDMKLVFQIALESDYPGENIFINATPANFTANDVPNAGEIIYSVEELKQIVNIYHKLGKKIGAHVAGEEGIRRALEAGVDVLHHAHGITEELMEYASNLNVSVVATPMGGTHVKPNSPDDILHLLEHDIPVSISTDSYLPPRLDTTWLPFKDQTLRGPESLMIITRPAMLLLRDFFYDENEILALLTKNPAKILGKEKEFGQLDVGMKANFLVAEGIPGLEIYKVEQIKSIYYEGKKVINRM